MDAYSPFPIEELADALGFRRTKMPLLILLGGIAGALSAFALQYYCAVVSYPVNVGGRPLNSWPSFIPVTFELTILFASLTAVFGLLALCGLPMPYHPLFHVPRFRRPRATVSFCASRQPIRASIARRRTSFCEGFTPVKCRRCRNDSETPKDLSRLRPLFIPIDNRLSTGDGPATLLSAAGADRFL